MKKIAEWIQRIQTLESQFRESVLLNCTDGVREGTLDMQDSGLVRAEVSSLGYSGRADFDAIYE